MAVYTQTTKTSSTWSKITKTLSNTFLLLENGSRLLLETGGRIILEQSVPVSPTWTKTNKN